MKKFKKVHVEWYDAASSTGWIGFSRLPPLAKVQTTGYLIRNEKKFLTICGSYTETEDESDRDYGDCITIPRAWVRVKRLVK